METLGKSAQVQKSASGETVSIDCKKYTRSTYAYLTDFTGNSYFLD